MILWRSLPWVNLRWYRMATGHGVRSQVLTAIRSKPEDVKFLPIYTGMPGEEKQSISVGTENFFSINKQASPEKQKLAADFIYWLYSSPTGKAFVTNDLKFIAPFDTFAENEKPTDPLAKEVIRYLEQS